MEHAIWNSEYQKCSCGNTWHLSEGGCDCEPCEICERGLMPDRLHVHTNEDGDEMQLCYSCEQEVTHVERN